LHFNDFTNTFSIHLDVSNALVVLDDAGNSEVKATEDDSLLDVLDERQNICIDF